MTIVTTPPAVPDLLGTSPADLTYQRDLPQSTATEANERAARIRDGLDSYTAMRQDIADAYSAQDWLALEYGSWPEYVMAEFGPELQRLARGDRRQAVADRRAEGMSMRQIGRAVGISAEQVRRDLQPEPAGAQVSPDVTPEAVKAEPTADRPKEPLRVTGTDGKSYPSTKPKPPTPADPAVVEAREKAKQEARDRDAGRTWSARIVPDLQTAVVTIGIAIKLGEPDLITADMVRQCREAVDLLEAMFKGEK